MWGGLINSTPDGIPVISAVDTLPGLYLSTGYSGHGFGIGPGAGRLAADLIAGDPPIVDPHPFRYSRMIDGTRSRRAGDDVETPPSALRAPSSADGGRQDVNFLPPSAREP